MLSTLRPVFDRLRSGAYDWDDLRRLLRPTDRIESEAIVEAIEFHFRALNDLTELELDVIADAREGATSATKSTRSLSPTPGTRRAS